MKISILLLPILLAAFVSGATSNRGRVPGDELKVRVNKTQVININGIKQFISIKGKDSTNPILLFLHGGPGGSVMNNGDKFTSRLQEHFIVVQWDQRQTNKTLQLNSSPTPLTVALFQNDTRILIDSLLKQFKQQKLYLVAHSWGSVLGFYIADKYPQLLYAFVAISPMVNQTESERMTLAMLKQQAENRNNENQIKELSLVKIPFENGKQLYYARKWLFSFNGEPIANRDTTRMINYINQWSATWLPVWKEAMQLDLSKNIVRINCPVYFCLGTKDYQTNFTIAEQYYNGLVAAKKRLFWFKKSGHLIPTSEPSLLQDILIKEILPETLE